VLVDQRQRARLVAGRFRVMRRTMVLIATCGTALASSVSHRLGWGRPPARRNTADAVSNRNGRTMPNNASVWEVRLGIYSTRHQAEEIMEQITRLMCPDPEHAPPCPIPWSVALLHGADLDSRTYPELVEQARIENR
jgi:hypothetical protein